MLYNIVAIWQRDTLAPPPQRNREDVVPMSQRSYRFYNYLALGLVALSLALMFTPYWCYDKGKTASIYQYVWFPGDYKPLETYLSQTAVSGFNINDVVRAPALMLLFGVAAMVVCLIKADDLFSLIPVIPYALLGIVGFSSVEVMRLGGLWCLQQLLCFTLLAVCMALILRKYDEIKARRKA